MSSKRRYLRHIPRPQQGEAVTPRTGVSSTFAAPAPVSPEVYAARDQLIKHLTTPIPAVAPGPVLYDGLTARECWHHWCDNVHWIEQRGPQALHAMTTKQIAIAKIENTEAMEAWPRRLRARIAARAESERLTVLAPDDDLWLANCKDAE